MNNHDKLLYQVIIKFILNGNELFLEVEILNKEADNFAFSSGNKIQRFATTPSSVLDSSSEKSLCVWRKKCFSDDLERRQR